MIIPNKNMFQTTNQYIYIYTCVYIYIHNIGLQSMSIDFLQTQIGAAKSLVEILENVAERKT